MSDIFTLKKFHTIVFDFDGVFTDNFVYVDENAKESVRVSRADGYAIDILKNYITKENLDISLLILSTEKNKVVHARAEKLQLKCISGEAQKIEVLRRKFVSERPSDPIPFSGLIYFGNDLNDLPVIQAACLSFAPLDAHAMVKQAATHVLSSLGGCGFIREGVEWLIGIDAMSLEDLSEFISNR